MNAHKRPVTIKDIAMMAGTSHATVSRVMNHVDHHISDDLRQKVLQVAKENNYIPNLNSQLLKKRNAYDIGVIAPNLTHPFFTSLLSELERTLSGSGFSLFISSTNRGANSEGEILRQMMMRRVCAIILLSEVRDETPLLAAAESGIFLICVCHRLKAAPCASVCFDARQQARIMAEYLLKMGHTRFGIIMPPLDRSPRKAFHEGLMTVLGDAEYSNANVLEAEPYYESYGESYEHQIGYALTRRVMEDHPDTTALIASNDMMAIGAIRALAELGLDVPGDVSVTGRYDTIAGRIISPGLTTVAEPVEDLCGEILSLLKRRFIAQDPTADRSAALFNGQLIVRQSTGAPTQGRRIASRLSSMLPA